MTTMIPGQSPERPEPPDAPLEERAESLTDEEAVSVIAAARAWLVAIGYRRPGADR